MTGSVVCQKHAIHLYSKRYVYVIKSMERGYDHLARQKNGYEDDFNSFCSASK